MPHTSHKRKSTHQKRTETIDNDGWTRISSHHGPQKYGIRASDQTRVDPHRVEDGMSLEKIQARYNLIEKKWQASELCKQLSKTLYDAVQATSIKIKTCVCFGTGSFSGLRHDWIQRHDVALYQIAAFQTAVDTIERAQSHRPLAYAQEPAYNPLDVKFLASLQIVKVDSPLGWEMIESKLSFCYCPGAEQFVSIMVIRKNPAFYLAGPLSWLRERQAEHACELPSHCGQEHSKDEQKKRLQMIDDFMDEHNVCTLPDLDAADSPFHNAVLYWSKPADA
jgi:hypothetical protein